MSDAILLQPVYRQSGRDLHHGVADPGSDARRISVLSSPDLCDWVDDDAVLEEAEKMVNTSSERRRRTISKPSILVLSVLTIIFVAWAVALLVYLASNNHEAASPHKGFADNVIDQSSLSHDPHLLSFNDTLNGIFQHGEETIHWVGTDIGKATVFTLDFYTYMTADDGVYLDRKNGTFYLSCTNRTQHVLTEERDILMYWISSDKTHLLLASNIVPRYRHSFYASYYLHDISRKITLPLLQGNKSDKVSLAIFSPKSTDVVYVWENNIYIRSSDSLVKRITTDGSSDILNGVPDWVYEEEILQVNKALWWNSDGTKLAFLRTNDTMVPVIQIPYYINNRHDKNHSTGEQIQPYPRLIDIKYPKPGYHNPVVNLFVYSLKDDNLIDCRSASRLQDRDRLVTEITWLGTQRVLLHEMNRESDISHAILVDVLSGEAQSARSYQTKGSDGGWLDITRKTTYIPCDKSNGRVEDGYIESMDVNGYNHLAYFLPLNSTNPTYLTSGPWEVVDGVNFFDCERNWIYFISTMKDSLERHLYRVRLDGTNLENMTDVSRDGFFDASFSAHGNYFLQSYLGPGIPHQIIRSTENYDFEIVVTSNDKLKQLLSNITLPRIRYSTVNIDGSKLNVRELLPPNYDGSSAVKYPVLFNPYGGPSSQTVNKKFLIDWHWWLVGNSRQNCIVVTVDGRGTGFLGRQTRVKVRNRLGSFEAADQIAVAKLWKSLHYVDTNKFAIWGWSFGGFLALKTLETDSVTFPYGVAVAPVTDWRLYDSVYAERYMRAPEHNMDGYVTASIHNMTALASAKRFSLMHGTGDDNVHFQNTLSLLDKLNLAGLTNFDLYVFPDSRHSINYHNAHRQVYLRLSEWLLEKFNPYH